MSFITSLISISSVATWIFLPLNAIFLTLDGIAYSLLAYTYKIFMLIAQLNYNVLYAWVSPLVDRVNAIILVIIMFKIGYSLIQYMINPDKLDDTKAGGPALIKNIGICAGLLIIYSFVFSVLNEVTLLMIGVPDGYEFTTLKEIADITNTGAEKGGFVSRLIFGSESNNVENFGKEIAITTLSTFLYTKPGETSPLDKIYNEIQSSDLESIDMMRIVEVVARIGKDVEYKWPIVSTAAGLYLAWQIIKLSIELAIRIFKLIVLQTIAPLAIVSIVDGGTSNQTWKSYTKALIGTWTDAFVRVGSLFIATAFIGKFFAERSELLPKAVGLTKGLITLIMLFAAFQCVKLIPNLLNQIFPGMGTGEDHTKGFGKLLGGIAGAGLGALSGAAAGIIGGAGAAGVVGNVLSGGFSGFQSGHKGKNVMDFFKNQGQVSQGNRDRAQRIARQGGGLRYAGAAIERGLGIPQGQQLRAQKAKDDAAALDNMMKARGEALGALKLENNTDTAKYKFGSTREETIENARKSDRYKYLEAQYNEAARNGNQTDMEEFGKKMKRIEDGAGRAYDVAVFANDAVNADESVQAATSLYDRRAGKGTTAKLRSDVKTTARTGGKTEDVVKNKRGEYEKAARDIENSPSVQRSTRQNIFGGK